MIARARLDELPDLLSMQQCADAAGVAISVVREAIHQGQLHHFRPSPHRIRIPKPSFLAWAHLDPVPPAPVPSPVTAAVVVISADELAAIVEAAVRKALLAAAPITPTSARPSGRIRYQEGRKR